MAEIRLENVRKSFGNADVIKGVTLEMKEGEFVVFVGPSGCGKSTLLRMIAGLENCTSGRIFIDGQDVTGLEPYDRKLSMVFQSYALYPHMTVRENIAFALHTAGLSKPVIAAKVAEAARILKLETYLDRRPKDLSGGQRQRVAIGRAIVREPLGFLFDEPLSNLDAALRAETRIEIAKLHKSLGATMVYVTHDQVEAMTLADKIVVLKSGEIMQVGTPRELFERPENLFVAQFIGSPKMNLLPCTTAIDGSVRLVDDSAQLDCPKMTTAPTLIGLRPEHLRMTAPEDGLFQGRVEVNEYLGTDNSIYVDAGPLGRINLRAESNVNVSEGEMIGLRFKPSDCHFFNTEGLRCQPRISGAT